MSTMMAENADEPRESFSNKDWAQTVDGQFIQMSGSTLLMTNHDGQKLFYTVAADATLSCEGRVCKSEELKPGTKIRLTINKSLNTATSVEAMESGFSTPK